jgi:hypothetical protein
VSYCAEFRPLPVLSAASAGCLLVLCPRPDAPTRVLHRRVRLPPRDQGSPFLLTVLALRVRLPSNASIRPGRIGGDSSKSQILMPGSLTNKRPSAPSGRFVAIGESQISPAVARTTSTNEQFGAWDIRLSRVSEPQSRNAELDSIIGHGWRYKLAHDDRDDGLEHYVKSGFEGHRRCFHSIFPGIA